jgi:hypothetical protein
MANNKHNLIGLPFVITDETGYMQLYTENGERIKGNLFLRVQDDFEKPPFVIGKFRCNISGSYDEMMEQINKWKGSENKPSDFDAISVMRDQIRNGGFEIHDL